MVDLALLQSVSYIAGALGVCVAAIFYILNLRISRKNQELMLKAQEQSAKAQQQTLETRQAQIFMQLSDTYIDRGYRSTALEMLSDKWSWKDYDDFIKKYGPDTNPEAWDRFLLQLSHWSLQGILVRDGLLSADKLWSWWGWVPRSFWEKFEPIISGYRESMKGATLHSSFELLYYSMCEEREKYMKGVEEELLRRAEKRRGLGLKPIYPYT
jgi:hypothetical protein